jgi:hypothetical protein
MTAAERSLKSLNMKWLVMLAVFDVLVTLVFVVPEVVNITTLNQLAAARALTTAVLPVLVLLLTGVLSHDLKASLVFWKRTNVLPGCRAFTQYGPADARVDMTALQKNVGALPTDPAEQNAKWYKLFQMVKTDAAVVEAQKLYLMYRDMAALSLPLIVLVPLGLYIHGAKVPTLLLAAAIFLAQFVVTGISARNSGVRFVCNVLAMHATKKIAGAKAPTA